MAKVNHKKEATAKLKEALRLIEEVADNNREALSKDGITFGDRLSLAGSHTRHCLRNLGVKIPTRKGPKPKEAPVAAK